MKKGIAFIAAGLGLGYSPVASGTVGSLWGVLLVYAMSGLDLGVYIAVCVGLALLSMPICDIAEQVFGKKDDGRIVADEYLTFPICMIGLYPFMTEYAWLLPMAFVSCRFFDIIKLPPARQFDRNLKGGLGITLDDVASSIYSLAANWGLFWAVTRYVL